MSPTRIAATTARFETAVREWGISRADHIAAREFRFCVRDHPLPESHERALAEPASEWV